MGSLGYFTIELVSVSVDRLEGSSWMRGNDGGLLLLPFSSPLVSDLGVSE